MLEGGSKTDDKGDVHTVGSCPSTETEEGTTTVHSSTSKADSSEKAGGLIYGVPDLSMVKVLVIRKNSQLSSRSEWPCMPVLVLGNQFQDNFEVFRKHLASLIFKTASLSQAQVEGICDFYFPATGLQVPLSHCVGQYIYYWRTMALNIPFHLIAVLEEAVFDTCFGVTQETTSQNKLVQQKGSGKEQAELQQKFSEVELDADDFQDLEVEEVKREVFDAFYGNYPLKINLRLYADNKNCFLMEGLRTEEGEDLISGDQVAEFLPPPESASNNLWRDRIEIVRADGSRNKLEAFEVAWWLSQDVQQTITGEQGEEEQEQVDIEDAEEDEEEEEDDEEDYDKTLLQLVQQESTRLLSGQGGSKLVVMRRHREQTVIEKQLRAKEQKSPTKNGKNHKKSSKK